MDTQMPRLLIIDDQRDSIALLLAFLDGFCIDITVCLSGEEGFQKAVSEQPDIIFLDVVMPDVDGFRLCKRLKLNPITAAIPVIFLSGRVELYDKLIGFNVGCIDYITKPYSEAEVLARLTAHLNNINRLPSPKDRGFFGINDHGNSLDTAESIIKQALQILKDNLAAPPTVLQLAHQLGTNERKLTGMFREHLGMTVFEYHCQLRLELACHLLTGTDMTIKLIADNCGYKNAGDFTRAFRQRIGVNPLIYRINKGIAADTTSILS